MQRFTDIFIQRPVLAVVVSLLILLAGMRSLQMLQVSQYPQSESAVVRVMTSYPGADADLVRGFVTIPLEREIASADGIDYLESNSLQGASTITAHLKLNYPPYEALTQITSKVNRVRADLPEASEDPVLEVAIGETLSAMYLSFNSRTKPQNQITDYLIRVVQPQIESIAGVQRAAILGGRNFAMRIWLDPERMYALKVTPGDVATALRANNYQAAVGKTKGDAVSISLSASTDLQTVEEFRQLVVAERDDAIVHLEDIATVALGAENYDQSVAFNGEIATFIAVDVLPTANPLEVVAEIRAVFPDIVEQLPSDITGRISYDTTRYIEDAISEVVQTLVEAASINRIQPRKQISRVVSLLRKNGIQNINFDLMYGLPQQTTADIEDAANYAAMIGINRLAVFGYAHVPWFVSRQRVIDERALPGLDARYEQVLTADKALKDRGYESIGFDHYALSDDPIVQARDNGTLRRNFQGYTDDDCQTLIGMGESSISSFHEGYVQNHKNRKDWLNAINGGRIPAQRGYALSVEDRVRADIIELLLCYREVDVATVCSVYDHSVDALKYCLERLEPLQTDGLCDINGALVTIPEDRKYFARQVAAKFDAFATDTRQHAIAV